MTFFSRCDASQCFESGRRATSSRLSRAPTTLDQLRTALSGFFEDLGILCRYAAGLDYYGRDHLGTDR